MPSRLLLSIATLSGSCSTAAWALPADAVRGVSSLAAVCRRPAAGESPPSSGGGDPPGSGGELSSLSYEDEDNKELLWCALPRAW